MSGRNLDAFRHAQERLDRAAYLDDGYFGRWLHAAELILTDSATLAPGAIDARNLRGEDVDEPPIPEPARPDYVPTAKGSLRTMDSVPAFAVGERVRAKDISCAFGMAVSLHEADAFSWPAFQAALIARIRAWETESTPDEPWNYYQLWLAALEDVLVGLRAVSTDEVTVRSHALAQRAADHDHRDHHDHPH